MCCSGLPFRARVHHSNPDNSSIIWNRNETHWEKGSLTNFREAIYKKNFTLMTECILRPETNAELIRMQADVFRECTDAVLLTDNQHGQLHMSTLAAAKLMLDNGIDPVMQLSCRNRNRIVLLSDLLGASALGVTSLLLVRGDQVPAGFDPRPKAVFDVNAKELISTASTMNEDERLNPPPNFFIGGVVTPHSPNPGWTPRMLAEKVGGGLHYVVTHLCMDLQMLRKYMDHLVANEVTRRIAVIATTAVLSSAEDALWLRKHRPNAAIPDALVKRLEESREPKQEGIAICAEQLAELATIPGIDGANIMVSNDMTSIPAAISAAGLKGT
jgi:methylenetetrahydrofolate reductase (NADPH)